MSHPERPHFQSQDPNNGGRCMITVRPGEQSEFGWRNCTPTSYAMGIERATLGRHRPSGCDIRRRTGDTSGGTMLTQCAAVAKGIYGVDTQVHVGPNFIRTDELRERIENGRGAVVQGNAVAMVGTPQQSTRGAVNHAVYANDIVKDRDRVLVYDPARSDRRSSFGKVEAGPQWWSWKLLVEFAAKLRPNGDGTSQTLGHGRAYAAIFPDTEPHVHLRFAGSHRTDPLPRELEVRSPVPGERINVRKGPGRKYDVVRTKRNGQTFRAWQRTDEGQEMAGSRTWWGNHSGTLWVHDSGVIK